MQFKASTILNNQDRIEGVRGMVSADLQLSQDQAHTVVEITEVHNDTVENRRPPNDSNNDHDLWWLREDDTDIDVPKSQDAKATYLSFLESLVQKSTRLPANRLEHRATNSYEAITTASSSSVFFTSRPIEVALLKPLFRLALLAFITRNVLYICMTLVVFGTNNGSSKFPLYRLKNLPTTINASSSAATPVGLLSGGFDAPIHRMWWAEGSSLILELESDSPIDGWHIHLPEDTKMHVLRRVALEGSDDGSSWTRTRFPWAQGSSLRTTVSVREPFQSLDGSHRFEENMLVFVIDFRYSGATFVRGLEHPISLIGLSLTGMYSLKLEGRTARRCAAWTFCLLSLGYLLQVPFAQDFYEQLYPLQASPAYLSHGLGFHFLNRGYLQVILGAGLFTAAASIILLSLNPDHDWINTCIVAMMQVLLWFVIIARRQWVLRQARKEIRPDLEKYGQVWGSYLSETPHAMDELRALQSRVGTMTARSCAATRRAADVRQVATHPDTMEAVHAVMTSSRSTLRLRAQKGDNLLSLGVLVSNLDQLYSQATALDSVLKQKVVRWARESGGMLVVRQEGQHEGPNRFKTVQQITNDGEWHLVKWAGVKQPARAIQKLVRNYDYAASRLLDLCRQSIVFDSVQAMSACVAAINADTSAICIRVKNRMTLEYDVWSTGGYRDVALNLRIVSEMSQRLGVEEHVCELQLILKRFAVMKNDEGHRRYVAYRNMRAE